MKRVEKEDKRCTVEIVERKSTLIQAFAEIAEQKSSNAPVPQKKESNYSLGNEAVKNGDYAKALEYFKLSADEGNADAMYEISWMYHKG